MVSHSEAQWREAMASLIRAASSRVASTAIAAARSESHLRAASFAWYNRLSLLARGAGHRLGEKVPSPVIEIASSCNVASRGGGILM